jgi:hypothetical protein
MDARRECVRALCTPRRTLITIDADQSSEAAMPRYLIERSFSEEAQKDMEEAGARMKRVAAESFPQITWEHSHVVVDASGVRTFCVYEAPDEKILHEHADMVGQQLITHVYVIAGDVTPADFAV